MAEPVIEAHEQRFSSELGAERRHELRRGQPTGGFVEMYGGRRASAGLHHGQPLGKRREHGGCAQRVNDAEGMAVKCEGNGTQPARTGFAGKR